MQKITLFYEKANARSARAYNMLLRPKLEYTATVWEVNNQQLESEQRRKARIVTHRRRDTSSVREKLNQLSWPTL